MSLADRQASLFLSTLSLRRATQQKCGDGEPHVNFYPRSPCGERLFQGSAKQIFHFYPRSPCGERRHPHHGNSRRLVISIHALLAESDLYSQHVTRPSEYFYPRSPCGERLKDTTARQQINDISLSTLSLRRATSYSQHVTRPSEHFYPRSPCGERQQKRCLIRFSTFHFYPRSPCGERQGANGCISARNPISIHALLAESDPPSAILFNGRAYFYPRSPCGERLGRY